MLTVTNLFHHKETFNKLILRIKEYDVDSAFLLEFSVKTLWLESRIQLSAAINSMAHNAVESGPYVPHRLEIGI